MKSQMHDPNTGIQLPPQCAAVGYNRDIVYVDSSTCHKSKNSSKVIKAAICGIPGQMNQLSGPPE